MKKLFLILAFLIFANSEAQIDLNLTEDTYLTSDEYFASIRLNGYWLYSDYSITVQNSINAHKGNQEDGGGILAGGNITVGRNIFFFQDGATIKSLKGIIVSNDVLGTGNLEYCTFLSVPNYDETVTITQDCTLHVKSFDFNILSKLIGKKYIIYNVNYQVVHRGVIDENTREFRSSDQYYFLEVEGHKPIRIPF